MSRMKDHMLATGEFHAAMSKAHTDCAENCEDESQQEFHKAAAACHAQQADRCLQMCKSIDGGDERDFSKLVPTAVSGVAPTAPAAKARPVFRDGQRIFNAGAGDAIPNHPSTFEKIFGTDIVAEE